jgi:hypothetical protein
MTDADSPASPAPPLIVPPHVWPAVYADSGSITFHEGHYLLDFTQPASPLPDGSPGPRVLVARVIVPPSLLSDIVTRGGTLYERDMMREAEARRDN